MSTKRQPSKQRRQTQNQRQRAALEARTANAAAEATPTGKVGGDAASASAPPATSGSALSRLTGSGGSTGARSARRAAASDQPVGYRAAVTAVALAGTAALFVIFAFRVPVGAGGDPIVSSADRVAEWSGAALDEAQRLEAPTADEVSAAVEDWSPHGKERYLPTLFPRSLAIFLPVLAAGLGFQAVRQRRPAKIVNRAMYATLFGSLLTVDLLVLFIPTVISMAVASFQVRKYEFATVAAAAPAAAPDPDDAPDGEVIDVDEVDDSAP